METTILNELLKIPADATDAEVMGVAMQTIDPVQAQKMLATDTEDTHLHECFLENGRFLFACESGILKTLYKVSGTPQMSSPIY